MSAQVEAIRTLKELERSWPKGLWLFSADGRLYVMRLKKDGTRAYLPSYGVDPDYIVTSISIPSDGGDW